MRIRNFGGHFGLAQRHTYKCTWGRMRKIATKLNVSQCLGIVVYSAAVSAAVHIHIHITILKLCSDDLCRCGMGYF